VSTRGGGVALIPSNRFIVKRIVFDIVRLPAASLRSASVTVAYVVIYRPGSQAVSQRLYGELAALLEIVVNLRRIAQT